MLASPELQKHIKNVYTLNASQLSARRVKLQHVIRIPHTRKPPQWRVAAERCELETRRVLLFYQKFTAPAGYLNLFRGMCGLRGNILFPFSALGLRRGFTGSQFYWGFWSTRRPEIGTSFQEEPRRVGGRIRPDRGGAPGAKPEWPSNEWIVTLDLFRPNLGSGPHPPKSFATIYLFR